MSRRRSDRDPVRRRIESLDTSLRLPTVRRALGLLEGEHSSGRRGGGDERADLRAYEFGDETRMIDWHASARMGRPMVVERERLVTSKVWLLLDVGREMSGTCPDGEQAIQVAANALCMFASLSLRRSDEVDLVLVDSSAIRRIPCQGGFARFEQTLDRALESPLDQPRNLEALLGYAAGIQDRQAMLVIATDQSALHVDLMPTIRQLATTHPLNLIGVETMNPLRQQPAMGSVTDAPSGRRIPAFLRTANGTRAVDLHRRYQIEAFSRELSRIGASLIRADSSTAMFNRFIHLLSVGRPGIPMRRTVMAA